MRNKNRKQILLSVVALLLVALMTVGVTYSWIDDLKLVEFQNDSVSDNKAPLKAGVDINSDVVISKSDAVIDLGNMLYSDKTNIMYLENDAYHVRYDTNNDDASKEPNWTNINQKKGYFYESGDMHLSGCYGDGENFYFPLGGSNGFREGNKDDENVNYISMTMKVSSPNANVDFWFREVPTVKVHSAEDPTGENSPIIPQARYAISVDGDMHVYSSTGTALTKSATNVSTTAVPGVRKTSAYTFNDEDNESSIRGKNGNTLFSIKKGDTVTLNVKIWLESGFSSDNIQNVDVRMAIVSSYAYDRVITIVDKTMGPQGKSWIKNNSAKLYLTLPAVLNNLSTSKSEWSNLGNDGAPFFALNLKTKVNEDDPDEYEVTIPMIYNNEEMILYRCNDKGWNDNLSDAKTRSPYLVHCWNWWRSFLPDSFQPETYTLYGCSLDKSAYDVFGDEIPAAPGEASNSQYRTNLGYGTWGGVDMITVSEKYNNVEYAPHNNNNTDYKLFVRDYSDFSTTGITYTYQMYYNDYNWYSYVPKSSALLQFAYYNSSNHLKGKWGYDSWQTQCPQQRPLKGDIYNNNSLTYQMTQNHSSGNNMDQGRGYWNNADKVYLIKSGNYWSTSVPHAFMKDDNTNSKNPAMTLLNGVKYAGTTDVYISSQSHINDTTVYWDVYFNNGANDDSSVNPNNSWTVNSGQKYLFPGCFYDFANNQWLGSLRGSGRDAATVETDTGGGGGGGGSSETNTDSMDGYSNSTNFTFQVNYNNNTRTYDVFSNSSSDAGSSTFKVDIELGSGVNWITVQKSGTGFGLQKTGQIFTVGSNMGLYITNASGQRNNFGFRAADAGHYIAYFQYDNGNMNTLKIASVLKKAAS